MTKTTAMFGFDRAVAKENEILTYCYGMATYTLLEVSGDQAFGVSLCEMSAILEKQVFFLKKMPKVT